MVFLKPFPCLFNRFLLATSKPKKLFFNGPNTVSPDAKTLCFSYDTDLWMFSQHRRTRRTFLTPWMGKRPYRFPQTANGWPQCYPSWHRDIFVMPWKGGRIHTYLNDAADDMDSWAMKFQ